MPLGNKKRNVPLEKRNLAILEKALENDKYVKERMGLLLLIADMFDAIAKGENWYMVIGSTKQNDSFSVTIKSGDNAEYIFGTSLDELSAKALSLL